MNEQVTDMSQVLKRLTSEMIFMREGMDALRTENANLRRNVEKLQAENRTLRKRLEKYEKPKKNSNNSSTPPSKESMKDEALRRTKSQRKKSGLKPGGQLGHEGHGISSCRTITSMMATCSAAKPKKKDKSQGERNLAPAFVCDPRNDFLFSGKNFSAARCILNAARN